MSSVSKAELAQAYEESKLEGAAAERERIVSILQSEHAKDRMQTALHLAKSGVEADVAIGILRTLPLSPKAAGQARGQASPQFASAMQSMQRDQEVGADLDVDLSEGQAIQTAWARARHSNKR